MTPLSNTVVGLIESLDRQYPPKCIGSDQTEIEAQRYAGKRELIDHLLEKLEADERQQPDLQVLNR